MPMFFSVLAGTIPLSLRNGGGAFDTVCHFPTLSASGGGGQLPPLPHRLRRLWCSSSKCTKLQFSVRGDKTPSSRTRTRTVTQLDITMTSQYDVSL